MLLKPTNIHEKLILKRKQTANNTELLDFVRAILAEEERQRTQIRTKLQTETHHKENSFIFDALETEHIFHLSQIREICIDYRLRFLDSHLYKIPFPEEAVSKIKHLENIHKTELNGFKIMAPSKVFQLKRYDDPILFAPMGNDYYYLIHKWGNDLHPLRKWLVLPFRNLTNLLLFFGMLSCISALLLPNKFYGIALTGNMKLVSFLFLFKYWCAIGLYYAVAKGKNFNANIWNSNFGG